MPAPYETRGVHVPTTSGATQAQIDSAYIRLRRHEVESTAPFTLGAGNYIRVHAPGDVAPLNANTTGWVTDNCDIYLGPSRLATGQSLAVFGGWPEGRKGAYNPDQTADAGTSAALTTVYAHKATLQDTVSFIKLPTVIRGQYFGAFPLASDVSITLTYRLKLASFTVTEYEPFPLDLK